MQTLHLQEKMQRPQGFYRIKTYEPLAAKVSAAYLLRLAEAKTNDERNAIYREMMAGRTPKSVGPWVKNLIVDGSNTGVNLIVKGWIGDATYGGIEIDTAAIGTGTNTPADTDTALQTPTLTGILRATQEEEDTNIARMEFFIADAQLSNGTYTEFALYRGTQLFARSLISPTYTKSTAEDAAFEYRLIMGNT